LLGLIIGEGLTLEASSELIRTSIQSEDWRKRWFGYNYLGWITDACKRTFEDNIAETVELAASGVIDSWDSVRYQAIQCIGLMLLDLSPFIQRKYHAEIIPKFLSILETEENLKMINITLEWMVNFVSGLEKFHYPNIEDECINRDIMMNYSGTIFSTFWSWINKALENNENKILSAIIDWVSFLVLNLKDDAIRHYQEFATAIKPIISMENVFDEELNSIRIACFEAIGWFMISFSQDEKKTYQAKKDAKKYCEIIMNEISAIIENSLSEDFDENFIDIK
jgi:hypothetical protein